MHEEKMIQENPLCFGLEGVLLAGPIADGLAALLSVSMVSIHLKGLTKQGEKVKMG